MRTLPSRTKKFQHLQLSQYDFNNFNYKENEADITNNREKLSAFLNLQAYNIPMAVLTVYSIFAIDIEKSFFDQPAAFIFGYVHILAISIFTVEIILSWLGKANYPLSFYFWIDIISTMSMLLEITWIQNFLTANSNIPAVLTIAKVVKASRLSRIGGRAAKVILMFLNYLKNKKAEERNQLKDVKNNTQSVNGQSLFKTETAIDSKAKQKSQMDYEAQQIQNRDEVSGFSKNAIALTKKVLDRISEEVASERTSKEQIDIIKSQQKKKAKEPIQGNMLGKRRSKNSVLVQNSVRQKNNEQKLYQISNIVERMQNTFKLEPLVRRNVPADKREEIQRRWKEVCQREEQRKNQATDKISNSKQNFKLGQILKGKIQMNIIIMIMSLIIILPLTTADTWYNKDPTIYQLMENYLQLAQNMSNFTQLSAFLQQMITASLTTTSPIIYLQISTSIANFTYPGNFSDLPQPLLPVSDYMQPEIMTVQGNGYLMVLNSRSVSQLTANINLLRSLFITVLLIFSTIIFMYSIENNALIPLQQMCISINKISTNPLDALKQINEKQEELSVFKTNNLQTNILQRAIWRMTNLLVVGAGEVGSELILAKTDETLSNNSEYFVEPVKTHGVFMQLRLSNYEQICRKDAEDILIQINKAAAQIHQIAIRNGGVLIEETGPTFLLFWKTPQEITIELERSKYFVAGNPLKNLGKTIQTQRIIQLVLRTYLQISIALTSKKKNTQSYREEKEDQQSQTFIMQAGIHMGNGFQGSIGSKMKKQIKAISVDIQYTKKLCKLAGQYQMSNIISHQLCQVVDDLESNCIRRIDYVKEVESGDVYWIYSWDFTLVPLGEASKVAYPIKKRKKLKKTQKAVPNKDLIYKLRQQLLTRLKTETIETILPLTKIQKNCQKAYTLDFYEVWNTALDHYFNGEWEEAIACLQNIQSNCLLGYRDIMSSILLRRIAQSQALPPPNWQKCHVVYLE